MDTISPAGHSQADRPPPRYTRRFREQTIALSDERDQWLRRVLDSWRDGYLRGDAAGYERGRRDALGAVAAIQRRACDHIAPALASPTELRLMIRRYAPPGWRGRIPRGMQSADLRRWLAALPREGDRRPGK